MSTQPPPQQTTFNGASVPGALFVRTVNDTPRERASLLNKPEEFSGDKAKFKTWFRQIGLYIRDCKELKTNEQKINLPLSYIRGQDVAGWVENFYDQHYTEVNLDIGDDPWDISYANTRKELQDRFTETNLARQAQIKIESLYQGSGTPEDFFQKFEILLTQAGYQKTEAYVTRLIETNINDQIIDQIYSSQYLPDDYDNWKATVLRLDGMWRCRNKAKRGRQYTPKPQTQQTYTPRAPVQQQSLTKPLYTGDWKDGTGTTFGGAGEAMKIDEARRRGLCFHCGIQGHLARDCPKKDWKFQVARTE